MVFGVFDLLHPGHLYLLYHARLEGRELVAVVARDRSVQKLKGRSPEWTERRRMRAVKDTGLATKVVLGDEGQSAYTVIEKHRPSLICLGYDQKALKIDLRARMKKGEIPPVPLKTLRAYRGRELHTSKLRLRADGATGE